MTILIRSLMVLCAGTLCELMIPGMTQAKADAPYAAPSNACPITRGPTGPARLAKVYCRIGNALQMVPLEACRPPN